MELMQIDLQTLLKAKPVESEFPQFFLCQIMVRLLMDVSGYPLLTRYSAQHEIHPFSWCGPP